MITKKLIIDGTHYDVSLSQESDGDIRVEIMDIITMKSYNIYPDNKFNFKES